jgi:hypothetical protein
MRISTDVRSLAAPQTSSMPGNDAGPPRRCGSDPGRSFDMLDSIGVVELREAGFTPEQIEQLTALKALYPVREYVVSGTQLARLVFYKWLYANGGVSH